MSSMESSSATIRTALVTAIAPMAWGSTYIVTERFLPPDRPLFSAAVRALPVGLVLLAWRKTLPPPGYRLKVLILGLANIGLFFPLIFLSAYNLPGGLASTMQALSPLAVMAMAFVALGERAGVLRVVGGIIGVVGVALLVLRNPGHISTLGVVAAVASVVVSGVGFILVKKWPAPVDMLTLVSWQLVVAGIFLVPLALLVEGPPPALDAQAIAGYVWVAIMGTGVAYFVWFRGLTRMPAGAVALIGLINPVVGTLLGIAFAGEIFGWTQALGMVLVLGGVLLGQRKPRAAATPSPRTNEPTGSTPVGTAGADELDPAEAAAEAC